MRAFGATDSDFVIKLGSRAFLDALTTELGLSEADAKKLRGLLDRRAKMPEAEFDAGLAELGVPKEKLSPSEVPQDIAKIIEDFHAAGIPNIMYDPGVVRGFDYYTGIVFEVFDTHPENNRALFGGGRYDNLLSLFLPAQAGGDEKIPAVGVACGDVTIHDFLAVRNLVPPYRPPTHVYVAITSPDLATAAHTFASQYLRPQGVNVAIDFGDKKLADQIKTANKHKIPYLIVLGPDELASGRFVVRDLASGDEKTFGKEQLAEFFLNLGR